MTYRQMLAFAAAAVTTVAVSTSPALAWGVDEQTSLNRQTEVDAQRVAVLVQQLGDPSYRVREQATRSLTKLGVPAKVQLLKALSAADAEVRYRARLVLSDVLELDFKQRLEAFIADVSGSSDHDLPGWKRFREQMGDGPAARQLFADMQRNEPALMEAADEGTTTASTAFDARCQQIQEVMRVPGRQTERQVPLGTVAALLFVGADGQVPVSMQSAMYVTNFCYQQPFRQAIAGGDTMVILKKLVGGWVRRDFSNDTTASYQTMMLALQFNIREGVEPAMLMLKDGGGNPHMRQYALLVVGKFGDQSDIARLEPLLNDQAICAQQQIAHQIEVPKNSNDKGDATKVKSFRNEIIETQIRDVTLAVMLHLTGQKLADYGFTRVQTNATILFNTATLGFSSPGDRDAALAKWRAWRAEQGAPK